MVNVDPWAEDDRYEVASDNDGLEEELARADSRTAAAAGFETGAGDTSARLRAAAEAFAAETLRAIDALAARVEESLDRGRQIAEAAGRAASEAKAAYEALGAVAQETRAEASAAKAEAAAAVRSAEEAREKAAEALARAAESEKRPADPAPAASQLLDRLEEDYRKLATIVQELQSRMSTVVSGVPAPPVDEEPTIEPEAPTDDAADAPEAEQPAEKKSGGWFHFGSRRSWEPGSRPPTVEELSGQEPSGVFDAGPESAEPDYSEYSPAAADNHEESIRPAWSALEGSVLIEIAPIPDFDRLLSLDTALGRLDCLISVTLADYERDEAVFRVEVGQSLEPSDLAARLSEATGLPLRVERASADRIELRAA